MNIGIMNYGKGARKIMWVIMFFIFAAFRSVKLITLCFLACCIVQGLDFYFDYLIRDRQLTMVTASVDFYEKIGEIIKNDRFREVK